MRRFLWLLPLLVPQPAMAEASGELRTFGDWVIGCDNRLSCTAIGLSADMAPVFAYLRVAREAGAQSEPAISVSILDESSEGGPIALAAADAALPVGTLQPRPGDGGMILTSDLEAGDAVALVDALLPLPALYVSMGETSVSVSLEGMSAALRYLDAAQERAGTAGALVARGERPADTVPPAPEPAAVAAVSLEAIAVPTERPDGLPVRDEYCPEGGEDTVFRTADGTLLWGVCTASGAYNLSESFSIVEDGRVRPADFGAAGTGIGTGEAETGSILVNAGLEEDGRRITAFARGRGLGDCGTITSFAFDGEGFVIVDESAMGECRGVSPEDWPTLVSLPLR